MRREKRRRRRKEGMRGGSEEGRNGGERGGRGLEEGRRGEREEYSQFSIMFFFFKFTYKKKRVIFFQKY